LPSNIRVYELARELGLTNKETLDLCVALGIGVKSHSSSVVEPQADRVRRKAEREGLYYGQCSKICGKDHAFMPIAVRVVSDQKYQAWVEEAKKKFAAAPSPNDFADNAAIRQ
jgi:hypothetical protein